MDYQSSILNALIDKYENSKHYYDGTAFTQRVIIDCRNMIDVTDYAQNVQFLSAVAELKEKNFIDCD